MLDSYPSRLLLETTVRKDESKAMLFVDVAILFLGLGVYTMYAITRMYSVLGWMRPSHDGKKRWSCGRNGERHAVGSASVRVLRRHADTADTSMGSCWRRQHAWCVDECIRRSSTMAAPYTSSPAHRGLIIVTSSMLKRMLICMCETALAFDFNKKMFALGGRPPEPALVLIATRLAPSPICSLRHCSRPQLPAIHRYPQAAAAILLLHSRPLLLTLPPTPSAAAHHLLTTTTPTSAASACCHRPPSRGHASPASSPPSSSLSLSVPRQQRRVRGSRRGGSSTQQLPSDAAAQDLHSGGLPLTPPSPLIPYVMLWLRVRVRLRENAVSRRNLQ
uniref:Uncharacterized protein n=1 Tax=Oryza barthii TaxID=65489 RepID=A0A0D3EKN1_9ORYZ